MKVLLIEDSDLIFEFEVAKSVNHKCSCIWTEITVEDDIIILGRVVTHLFCVIHGRQSEEVGAAG